MSKRVLNSKELQTKIDSFLKRKNSEMARLDDEFRAHPIFDFKNDSLTYTF